ncbi:MAG: Hsp33 family molecular chaperone HslO [Burkholderiaceae bacterium]
MTLDPRDGDQSALPGVVPLEGESIAQALEQYMLRSEQLPTRLWLAADEQQTAGLLLQRLPGDGGAGGNDADADTWPRVQQLADTLQPAEMLASDADTMIRRLFWQEAVSATETRPLQFACSCSRDRVARMLQSLGADEVNDILEERGEIIVHCDYCNERYDFDAVDSLALFRTDLAPGSDTPQ